MRYFNKLILIVITAAALVCLGGCSFNTYSNSDKYTAGDREIKDTINELDIDWSAGQVTITTQDQDYIRIKETCSENLDDSKRVHSWVDGKILRVKFSESGESFFFHTPEKNLEITIPKDMKLKNLSYDGSSGDCSIEGIESENIYADVSSANVDITDCTAQNIDVDSSSGEINIVQKGESDKISADSSSGKVSIAAETVDKVRADTSSGRVSITAEKADDINVDTSSGDAKLAFGNTPSDITVDTSSGDVSISLPKQSDFTAEIDTSSGDFYSDFSLSKDDDTYTCGSGKNRISIDTSSGDINILTKE